MTRAFHTALMAIVGTLGIVLAGLSPVEAVVSNADYTAVPAFVSNATTPNIIILMDNSGSMGNRACESTSCGTLASGGTSTTTTFTNTTTYSGYFDSLYCYVYNTTDTRFVSGTAKAVVATACSTTEWDGNFLNWATLRRFDAVKRAMAGGDCSVARNADGTCPATGTPALKTVRAQYSGVNTERADIGYHSGTGLNTYVGRIPSTDRSGDPATISIGVSSAYFCVDNDTGFDSDCTDSYSKRKYELQIGYTTEPTGVIQQIGSKARFGLVEFKSSSEGARMLVGAGSRQSINWSGSGVETFATNTAAMVDAVQESYPSTWTPLSESLYETARYVAQIQSTFATGYVYPIAFSGGSSNAVNFATNGAGSIGTSELSALISGESCPGGYITSACGRDPYFFGANHTPPWASASQIVNCCRTFVIIFTDGEPTQDQNIPSAIQDYAHAHHGVHCVGADGAAPTRPIDGICNTHAATPFSDLLAEHKTDYGDSGSHYLDDVAYWAHTTDLRPCNGTNDGTIVGLSVTGHCLPGSQSITVYSFFAFGNINGRGILAQTARLGGFEDANGDGIPQTNEWDKENNLTGASTPDGIPDAYFESSNVDDLQDKLLATIASILRRSASGSSVSVLATASTGEGSLYQSYFYPSTIEPSTLNDVKWTGYTQAYFIDTFGNTREDSDNDGRLDYKVDRIIKTRFDAASNSVRVDKYIDSDGDGLADDQTGDHLVTNADCSPCGQSLSDIKPIWEAGKQLALKDASTRNIFTWVDANHDGIVDYPGERVDFVIANESTLRPYLRASTVADGTKIINFIRGCEATVCSEQATTRDRRLQVPYGSGTLKTWKLGDVIHSTPTVVAGPKDRHDAIYGDQTYSAFLQRWHNRRQVAYVGGNDGMLHAFNAGYYHPGDDASSSAPANVREHGWFTTGPTDNSTGSPLGDESWGFIPYQLLPQLEFLTRADYQHVYYVDLPLKVADVRTFPADADHPNGWGTILIGGFRMGGSCGACTAATGAPPLTVNISGTNYTFHSAYFVMDITNPDAPKLLWSFSRPDLGLTTSVPAIVRVNPGGDPKVGSGNAKWFMVVGSGPTGYDAGAGQQSKVFAIDLATGPGSNNSLVTTFPVGSLPAYIGDITAFDRDLDYRHDAVYFGRVINDGSLPWRGKIYRLTMGSGATGASFGTVINPAQWGIAAGSNRVPTEMLDTFQSGAEMGPVASALSVAVDDAANVWVFAGSGRYYSKADKTDISTQYFVGLKDSVLNHTCNQTVSSVNCQEDDLVDVSSATVCMVGIGDCGQATGTAQVTGVTGASSFTSLVALVQSKRGWYTKLVEPASPPTKPVPYGVGERVITTPTVFGGIVFFPTFTPTNDICVSSGTSRIWALYYKTGSAYQEPIVGTAASGANQSVNKFGSLGQGLAFGVVVHMGSGRDGGSPFGLLINTSQGNFAGCATCGNNAGGGSSSTGGNLSLSQTTIGSNVAHDPRSRFFSWTDQ